MSARRGGRPKQKAAAPPGPRVEIAFSHLPLESRAELQRALIGWAHWHTQRYLPGYLPPSVASGRLAVEPARLLGGSLLAAPGSGWNGGGSGGSWAVEDVPAAPTALPPNFNVAYEQEGDVPRYDRATLRPLRSADGSAAGKRRAALLEAAGEAPPGPLLPSARCYNCGSYGHGMGQCFRERDAETEAVSLRQREEARAAQAGGRRYWTILLGAGQGTAEGTQACEPTAAPAAVPAAAPDSRSADGPADEYIPLDPGQQAEQGLPQQNPASQPPQQQQTDWCQQQVQNLGAWQTPQFPTPFPSAPSYAPPGPFYTPRPPQSLGSPQEYPFQPAAFFPRPTNPYRFALPAEVPGSGHGSWPASQQPQQPQQAAFFGQQFGSQQAPQQQPQQYGIDEQQCVQQLQAAPPPPHPPPLQQGSAAILAAEGPHPQAQAPLLPPGCGLPSTPSTASASGAHVAGASSGSRQLPGWQPPIPHEQQHRWHNGPTRHTAHQQQWGHW